MAQPVLKGSDPAPDFSLPGVDGKTHHLKSFAEKPVLVVLFSCNHCPYVQAYEDRLIEIQRDYGDRGVQLVAINSNDDVDYPEDSFENMVKRAKEKKFAFYYLRDESQKVARDYGATHTPHIAWTTREARRLLGATVANVASFLAGRPTNVVN